MRGWGPVWCTGLAVLCAAAGGAWVSSVGPQVTEQAESRVWASTEGQVVERVRGPVYTPYSYEEAPVLYRLQYVVEGRIWSTYTPAREGGSLEMGTAVRVHYDPESPWRSTLHPGVRIQSGLSLLGGMLLVGLALGLGSLGVGLLRQEKVQRADNR